MYVCMHASLLTTSIPKKHNKIQIINQKVEQKSGVHKKLLLQNKEGKESITYEQFSLIMAYS